MRHLTIFLVVLAMLFTAYKAIAEDNTLSATAPTENEDGSVLVDLDAIRVYYSLNGSPFAVLDTVPFSSPGGVFGYVHEDRLDGEHCYYLTALREGGQESVMSNQACKVVDTLLPNAPFGLVVN